MKHDIISLNQDTYDRLFPFHFSFNIDGVITSSGPSLRKIKGFHENYRIDELFDFIRPLDKFSYEEFIRNKSELYILKFRPCDCLFRGIIQSLDSGATSTFLGSPWITDPEQLSLMGLTLRDFAIHDQTLDMLHLLQSQKIATIDLKKLNAILMLRSNELATKEAEIKIKKDEIEAIYMNAPIGLGYFNEELDYIRLNQKLADVSGYSIAHHIGKPIHAMIPDIAITAAKSVQQINITKSSVIIPELSVLDTKTNLRSYYYIEWYPVINKEGIIGGYGLVVQDITKAKENELDLIEKDKSIKKMNQELEEKVALRTEELTATNQALSQLIRIDFLTGLPNRLAGQEQIRLEFLRMKRMGSVYCLMMIDIDHFKSVNDLYGHDVGDKKLQSVGNILQKLIRESDFLARWGGEEFIILLRDIKGKDAIPIAEKLRISIENNKDVDKHWLTISIGLTCSELNDDNSDVALIRADKLLYMAKNNGRNQICYDIS